MSEAARDLIAFIDASPTPYHAVAEAVRRLARAGFRECAETELWGLDPGDRRFVVRQGGSLVAFQVGSESPVEGGFLRMDSHTGAVSMCQRIGGKWACEAVADDRRALEAEIERLGAENRTLGGTVRRLEEQLGELLPGARIARFDADATRGKGNLERTLAAVHAGEIDVLVGTQMVTKGHDFRRITLVAAVNPDAALFSSDFRAPERQFALLLQAAGRAGRDAAATTPSEMWIQTWHPQHALFAALREHDYARFAGSQLDERRSAGLPPFAHLALLRAEARDAAVAQAFLRAGADTAAAMAEAEGVMIYPPVPPTMQRVAGIERMQMLVESAARARLQRFLTAWLPKLHEVRATHKGLARWAVDVDPQAI